MLQRQIMFKHLQELQRRQQLQDLGDTRNQNYVNQLSSLRQASGGQFPPAINGTPVQDASQMFMVGNMQMMQHDAPNGLVLSQSHNPVGLSQPQFDISLYGTHAPNTEKNLNQYSQFQGPSNLSADLLTKNNNSPLGMAAMQPFMSQRCNFSSDQMGLPAGDSLQSNQEKNLFGQVPIGGFSSGVLSGSYTPQGITMQRDESLLESDGRHEDAGWNGLSPGKTPNLSLSQNTASLDPLEQKILYNTDDNSWESSFSRNSKMSTGGFESTVEHTSHMDALPSLQSGSWSALMQSAVAETSSSDTGIQEEWSGLSFQNPEPLNDNQPVNFIDSEKLQNNWVDRNLQNATSPSSKPDHFIQNNNMNCSFPNFQQSGNQYLKQKEEYHSESSHATTQQSPRNTSQLADYNSQQRSSAGGFNSYAGHEFGGTFWLQGSTSHHVPGGSQKPFDQVNQLNVRRYSVEPENMAPGKNVEAVSTVLGASLDRHGESTIAPSESMLELLNKDDVSNDQTHAMQFNSRVSTPRDLPVTETTVASFVKPCNTSPVSPDFGFRLGPADPGTPKSYSFFPPLSTGNSRATTLSSHNLNDYMKNQQPAPPAPSHMATEFPAYGAASSQENPELKITHSNGPEFPLLENEPVAQPSLTSDMLQHAGFPIGLPTPWPDMATQQYAASTKSYKFSPNLFRSPDSASSSLGASPGAANEQPNQNSFQQEFNVQELGPHSGKSECSEQQLDRGSTEMHDSMLASRSTHKQEFTRKHHLDADPVGSGSLMTNTHLQPSNQAEGREKEIPTFGIGVFRNSLSQNYSLLHQLHSARNAETDIAKSFPPKYDNYQPLIANARELLMSGKAGVKDRAKGDLYGVSQPGAFRSGDNNGWNLSQEAQGDQSGKTLSTAYHQNLQQIDMFSQNDMQSRPTGSNVSSNMAYQSQVSLQMAPSWFKHYGTLKNGQMLSMYDPKLAVSAAKPFLEMTRNLQENSLSMQVNLASASQGSGLCPPTAGTSGACKQLNSTCMLPSDVTPQNLAVSIPKKRKLLAFDMVPWHKELSHGPPRLLDISTSELVWAEASNRRPEEVKDEAEFFEEFFPAVRAKRRLICTTQLMQQVFRPGPAVILWSDAGSNCDYVAYSAARLALGDACSITSQLPSHTNDMSPDELKTSKSTRTCEFSKVVECFINRVKKLEGDLSRLDKSLSVVDVKVEAQDLEKFSIINRFAKYHIRAQPSTVDPASSSNTPTLHKAIPQKYVSALPMPKIVPEGTDCISL
ncbi:hypothetical protein Salat_1390100 [Sesamum alatum]|uniref:Uncharacterized protein n=1 Tax=Sesamum alatum TaxID=300844 RepID=A0AAE2CL65_9LAMI|nr:hypothetical protein Salat_1390100 [Sesamum alatum]